MWGTVEEAADAASVQPDAVRAWCRAGLVPTDGEPGDELVSVDGVVALAEAIDLNVRYWADEAQATRAELRRLRARCEDLEEENAVLRASLEGQTLAFSRRGVPGAITDPPVETAPASAVEEAGAAVPPVAGMRPAPGEHVDDYLPEPEPGRRRRRR